MLGCSRDKRGVLRLYMIGMGNLTIPRYDRPSQSLSEVDRLWSGDTDSAGYRQRRHPGGIYQAAPSSSLFSEVSIELGGPITLILRFTIVSPHSQLEA